MSSSDYPASSNRKTWIAVFAASSGTLLEFYDLALYAFFIGTIAKQFFPSADPVASLLLTFAAFGVGYIARPVGSFAIGRIGDKHGRKPAMMLTVGCMAVGSIGMGMTPSYHAVGLAAPIFLVGFRIMQGFAAGGQFGTSAAFIVESSPLERRGFFGSFQSLSTTASTLLASVAASLVAALPDPATQAWAWRIPFVAGGVAIAAVSIFISHKAEETPEYLESKRVSNPTRTTGGLALGLKVFAFTIYWTVLSYLANTYMVTYTQREAGLSHVQALFSSDIALLVTAALMPFAGALSDRIGRKPLHLLSCAITAVAAYPLLHLMSGGASFPEVVALQCCLGALFAMFSGPAPATICEIFPTSLRTTWMSLGFTLSVSIFGGFSPLMSTWLIEKLHMPAAPALLLVPAALISGAVTVTLSLWKGTAATLLWKSRAARRT